MSAADDVRHLACRSNCTGRSTARMRYIGLATIVAMLLACANARLSSDVKAYVGRNIDALVARLGRPTGKRETTGDRVYVWSIDSEGILPNGASTEGSATSTITVQLECTLEVTINAEGIIQSYQVEGSDAGCAAFRRHLKR
jgi:hypothetical protein